jgi:energy-coupling factor transporter ATP-binding protein EcfA2
MIALKNLTLENCDFYLSGLSLEVAKGEIYFLLNRLEPGNDFLFRALSGFQPAASGEISYDGRRLAGTERPKTAVFIDRVNDRADFDTALIIGSIFCAPWASAAKTFTKRYWSAISMNGN